MKVKDLIEYFSKLDQEYEVMTWDEEKSEPKEIGFIDNHDANREYVIG